MSEQMRTMQNTILEKEEAIRGVESAYIHAKKSSLCKATIEKYMEEKER